MVGGRYCPLLASGLLAPAGAPMRLVWSSCGFTTFPTVPLPVAIPIGAGDGAPGRPFGGATLPPPTPPVPAPPDTLALVVVIVGGTCWPFLARGLDLVWSMPGVLRMEGLSARGLKARPPFGVTIPAVRDSSGSSLTARAEKKPTPSVLGPAMFGAWLGKAGAGVVCALVEVEE